MAFGSSWMPPLICCKCGKEAAGGDVFTVLSTKEVFCYLCAPKEEKPLPCPTCKGSGEATHQSEQR
jgi:DnaJ-class molecular chaperone